MLVNKGMHKVSQRLESITSSYSKKVIVLFWRAYFLTNNFFLITNSPEEI